MSETRDNKCMLRTLEWIKTKDQLPDTEKHKQVACLTCTGHEIKILVFNGVDLCWDTADFDDYYCNIVNVEYWMELPDIPGVK